MRTLFGSLFLPTVASRTETGFFVPAQDAEALAEKLRSIFVDHDLRAEIGARAAAYAKDFSWELITLQMIDVYQRLLASENTG